MNVLIAEDDEVIRLVVGSMINSFGYDFDIATDGQQAIELVNKALKPYDVCLMDLEMPNMDGITATRVLRKNSKYLPVLAFSSSREYKEQAFEAGVDAFLQKPSTPDELNRLLRELSVKSVKLVFDSGEITVNLENPMNSGDLKRVKRT